MKFFWSALIIAASWSYNAQVDINLLAGNWCIVKILNAPNADEAIPEQDLNEMREDMLGAVFCFTSANKFTVIEVDMTREEALEEALTFVYIKTDQILEMEDTYTGELILFELIKVTQTELVFRSYEGPFGFEMYFKRC